MTDVTFVDSNTGNNFIISTSDIQVVKVFTDKVRVKYTSHNRFATLTSYNTNKATLVANDVTILD